VVQARSGNVRQKLPEPPDEEFEKLRLHFHERLRREQSMLATLTKALANASADSTLIFPDIREFAHRLRGAALVFEFQKIAAAAKAVELAAIAATLDGKCQKKDPWVLSTMQALTMTLAQATTCPA
jgi:hypothetical protein